MREKETYFSSSLLESELSSLGPSFRGYFVCLAFFLLFLLDLLGDTNEDVEEDKAQEEEEDDNGLSLGTREDVEEERDDDLLFFCFNLRTFMSAESSNIRLGVVVLVVEGIIWSWCPNVNKLLFRGSSSSLRFQKKTKY